MTAGVLPAPSTVATATTFLHLGPADEPLAGWLSRPVGRPSGRGVVLVPPFGYEAWTVHRTYRTVAESLAARGFLALRYDPVGTGSSAGEPLRDDLVEAWRGSVRDAVAALRAQGCTSVALLGVRLGATLALLEADVAGADAVVAWLPVESGRRYARELAMLALRTPDDDGVTVHGGVPVTAAATKALGALTAAPAGVRTLVVDAPDRPVRCDVERVTTADAAAMVGVQCERASLPTRSIEAVVDWLDAAVSDVGPATSASLRDGGAVPWRGGTVHEREIVLGASGLRGILGLPTPPGPDALRLPEALTLFLPCGSEHGVGPGRSWVEYARHLNLHGRATLRLDLRGWGESPPRPDGRWGESYDLHADDDLDAAVADLRARGVGTVALVGLCWSAFAAMKATLRVPVGGVYALNPGLFWHPGIVPGEAAEESMRTNAAEFARIRRLSDLHVYDAADALGLRIGKTRWFDEVVATGTPIRMAFAPGDWTEAYLHQRLARPLRRALAGGTVTVTTLPGVDHQMHRSWLRPLVADDLTRWLESAVLR